MLHREFAWSPTDEVIAFWVPENKDTPARVTLMEIPSRKEIRVKNLFNVSEVMIMQLTLLGQMVNNAHWANLLLSVYTYLGLQWFFVTVSCHWCGKAKPLSQLSYTKLKPITTWSFQFSCLKSSLLVFTFSSHQHFTFSPIGHCNSSSLVLIFVTHAGSVPSIKFLHVLWTLNPSHPNISMHILHTVLFTFPNVMKRRICLTIKRFFSRLSSPLFSWPKCLIHGWYWKEKLDASHSQGLRD